jgi:hypothetical protein
MGFTKIFSKNALKPSVEWLVQNGMKVIRSHNRDGFKRSPLRGSKYAVLKDNDVIMHGDWEAVVRFSDELENQANPNRYN